MSEQVNWEWTWDAELTFRTLKWVSNNARILTHFELAELIIVPTSASGFGIAWILNQYEGIGILRLVSLYSRKC